ncbi:MAG: hypothetical protein K8F91_20520, partial [Candidatus Obscuribacterales bacterium]|nr:hypothetical protein [Candidatus Obscuribacterales bacterium]
RLGSLKGEFLLAQKAIEPGQWIDFIEGAFDRPDQMAFIRARRMEAVLRQQALFYAFHAGKDHLQTVRQQIRQLEIELVDLVSSKARQASPDNLRPVVISRLLDADRVRTQDPAYEGELPCPNDFDRDQDSLMVIKKAFAGLCQYLARRPVRKTETMSLATCLKALYSTNPVASSECLGLDGPLCEMRFVEVSDFVDVADDEYPALAIMPASMMALRGAVANAVLRCQTFKSIERGRVNERQYASRLVRVLDSGLEDLSVFPEQEERAKQHRNRLAYESARTAVYAEVLACEKLRCKLVETLIEAVAETELLDGQIECQHRATCAKLFARRSAILLCLQADVLVRESGRRLQAVFNEYLDDIADGKGEAAMESEFAKLTGRLS